MREPHAETVTVNLPDKEHCEGCLWQSEAAFANVFEKDGSNSRCLPAEWMSEDTITKGKTETLLCPKLEDWHLAGGTKDSGLFKNYLEFSIAGAWDMVKHLIDVSYCYYN